jgi:hypothetical protein
MANLLLGCHGWFTENQVKKDIVIPLIGSGRGRLRIIRNSLTITIAQSLINASENKIFSNKLKIVIPPTGYIKIRLDKTGVSRPALMRLHILLR